ncbi:hypothetical protein K439DRAFT_1624466 [Ramaria rubella]|nr:hypothetical protein K439DRAFT_1624466 [Ramaria rubella]
MQSEAIVRSCTGPLPLNESNCGNLPTGSPQKAPLVIAEQIDPDEPCPKPPSLEIAQAHTPPLDAADTAQEKTIAKPKGSCGNPSGGGYSLASALGWSKVDYKAAQKCLQDLAGESIDHTKSFKLQDCKAIEELCRKADVKLPILKQYEDHWATKDMLAILLRYSSYKAKISGIHAPQLPKHSCPASHQLLTDSEDQAPYAKKRV